MTNKEAKKEFERLRTEYRTDKARYKKELDRMMKEGEKSKDLFIIGAANYYYALISYSDGLRAHVLSYAAKAAALFDKIRDYDMASRSYNLLGIAYVGQENYQLALEAYYTAFGIIRTHKSCKMSQADIRNNIAECYYQMGDYKKSIKITSQCLKEIMEKDPGDYSSIVNLSINLAYCYESIEIYDAAEEVLDSVENIIEKVGQKKIECAFYARRACVAYAHGMLAIGNRYADKTLKIAKTINDTYELHRDFEKIARAQIKAGKLEKADHFADILLSYAKNTGHTVDRIIASRVKAEYYNKLKKTDQALNFYSELSALYEVRLSEEQAMQLEIRKRIEAADKEIKRLLEKIRRDEEIADKEPLTKLLNRNALLRVAGNFVEEAKKKKKKLGGIFIDIDFFKEYNDTYGHPMGDDVIRAVANVCLKLESPSVRFARYGGDEFFGIVLGMSDQELFSLAAKISKAIRTADIPHIKNPNGQRLTLSVGVANEYITKKNSSILDIINYSDKALYHVKNHGKNAICALEYDPEKEECKKDRYVSIPF